MIPEKKKKSTHEKLEELISFVEFDYYQDKHFMPNEIFNDLKDSKLKPVHIAFCYSYYYLTSWLFRHGKYKDIPINNKIIKEILGYSPNNKTLDYMIKEGGVLDSIEYTKSTKNYSVGLNGLHSDNAPDFLFVDELSQSERGKLYETVNRNFKAKYPIKHMHRYSEDFEESMLTGVFYDPSNTHQVDFRIFAFSMSNTFIGTIGFYIYCFLKNKSQIFNGSYQVSYEDLSIETGIPYSTLAKYLDNLRSYNMVVGIQNQEYYVEGLSSEDRESNYYIVNSSIDEFYFERESYTKIKGINLEQYKKITKEKVEK